MKWGTILLAAAALTAMGACAENGELAIRALPAPAHADGFDAAEGYAQLALGNVAMALQIYRKALRANPDSIAALAGVALCYDRMARFDLSRRYYEAALALAPRDPALLGALAASLDRQGLGAEAAAVRAEVAATAGAAPVATASVADPLAPVVETAEAASSPPASASATIRLAPAQPFAGRAHGGEGSATAATVALAPTRPRLERVSLGEVAMVTAAAPQWRPLAADTAAAQAAVPALRRAVAGRATIRLLNAARWPRLAARTQTVLAKRGWRQMTIGDAAQRRTSSLILYSPNRRLEAHKLARELGFASVARPSGDGVTVLLGRDAVRAKAPAG